MAYTRATFDLRELLEAVQTLRADVEETQQDLLRKWRPHLKNRTFIPSAANLAAYVGLRRHDLRALQQQLAMLGLSSLGRCEAHVLPTLDSVIQVLRHMVGEARPVRYVPDSARAIGREQALLKRHTALLLGEPPQKRWTRFMVTLPSEAAEEYLYVRDLVVRGMDCARINCAHDNDAAWRNMAAHVRRAEKETGRPCRVLMDLAGPKLRTSFVTAGPTVLHLGIKRDERGRVVQPARVILDASGAPGCGAAVNKIGQRVPARLSVPAAWLEKIKPGDSILFEDLRKRERRLLVAERLSPIEVLATCEAGAYIGIGTSLRHEAKRNKGAAATAPSGEFVPPPAKIRVFQDDLLLLTREDVAGKPEKRDTDGKIIKPAHISCSEPGVFAFLKAGHKVWIDDGRIGAAIEKVDKKGACLRITRARQQGEVIGAEKGLNFPDSKIVLPILNDDDLSALDCAVEIADLVGLSFVQGAEDMDRLSAELRARGKPDMGIVAKIETPAGVRNLPEIIAHGAGRHPFGVMIARGDLAVEIGYDRLAEIQEEILWLCEAAHVPVIWATQVLENMVKQDIPSRAEITDAAMAERAECVMLNKGPYLFHALDILDNVVSRMQHHQLKKTAQFRALHW
ncbi:pyruvate kinase [Candidatus Ferrigenium straubiae]|jgi:pyruvate kinase|uniref:pyruvate kinase n=1 Tax=Candidatus Ferrigenium straubiae TaxID=2919506 RepID=UPI003F4ABF53